MPTNAEWKSVDGKEELDPRVRDMFMKTFAKMYKPIDGAEEEIQDEEDFNAQPDDAPPTVEESRSSVPWAPPKKFKPEVYTTRPEKDSRDEMALKANFETSNPNIDTIRRRANHRPHLDFNCLPPNQRFIIITCYGPGPDYDIEADKVGFQVWGVYESVKRTIMRWIRKTNPHAVFVPMHIVELSGRVDLPPPNDGSVEQHHLNVEHGQFMSKHLGRCVDEAEYVENRKEASITLAKDKNVATQEYNRKINTYLKEMVRFTPSERKHQEETVLEKFQEYVHDPSAKMVLPNDVPFDKQVAELKSMAPGLVSDWIKINEMNNIKMPSTFKVEYKKFKRDDGKWALVRVISRVAN